MQRILRLTATVRSAFSTALSSIGMYGASVLIDRIVDQRGELGLLRLLFDPASSRWSRQTDRHHIHSSAVLAA
jgi:hypothetical protein